MSGFARVAVILSAAGLAGCGGAVMEAVWHEEPVSSAPVEGMVLAMDVGGDAYPVGQPIDVKVGLKNTLLKPRVVDLSGDWARCRFVITGPGGVVEPIREKVKPKPQFVKLGPGEHITRVSKGPASAVWKYEGFKEPGRYRIKAVYEAALSDEWNRLSVAGGPFEGEVLWVGKVETPEMEFEVFEPEGRKQVKETVPAPAAEGKAADNK